MCFFFLVPSKQRGRYQTAYTGPDQSTIHTLLSDTRPLISYINIKVQSLHVCSVSAVVKPIGQVSLMLPNLALALNNV